MASTNWRASRKKPPSAALRGYGAAIPPDATPAHTTQIGKHEALFLAEGTLRRVAFAGHEAVLPDLTGLRHVARLLAEPGA